jgi:hypothetical protein
MWKGTTNTWLRVVGNLSSWTIYKYTIKQTNNASTRYIYDCLCGLVVRVPGYRSRSPGSIPGTTRFPEQ